jgi:hypothetical protein
MNEPDAPEAALDAGQEGEAERSDLPMGDDAPPMGEDTPDEPVTDPNAAGGAMPTLIGSWYGPAEDLLERQYDACFVIAQVTAPGLAGTVRYTGALECEYDIEYIDFADGEFAFNSIVKAGRGCFPSVLRLPVPSGDMVRFNMYIDDGAVAEGTGLLTRATCP